MSFCHPRKKVVVLQGQRSIQITQISVIVDPLSSHSTQTFPIVFKWTNQYQHFYLDYHFIGNTSQTVHSKCINATIKARVDVNVANTNERIAFDISIIASSMPGTFFRFCAAREEVLLALPG